MSYRFGIKPWLRRVGYSAAIIVALAACDKKNYYSFEELDNANIREYIEKNNLTVHQYKETDLFYQVLEAGTGDPIDYTRAYPVVYTVKSLDGAYTSSDTLAPGNRYAEYFGYFPFGSAAAGTPTVERTGDFKEVIREELKNANGKIRIIVPSRLMYGRKGVPSQGIPPNASLDYVVTVHGNFEDHEDGVIQQMIANAGFDVEEFTKRDDRIYYKIIAQGNGDAITADSTVSAKYTLKNPRGEVLDTNSDAQFSLAGNVISAWPKIVPLVNKGGKIRFFTPSDHGYGRAGNSDIAPFLALDFEVEVLDK